MSELENVIRSFAAQLTAQLTASIEEQAMTQARSAIFAALGVEGPVAKRRGRPPKALRFGTPAAITPITSARRKAPRQLCPVPGCKNPAAPIFGMVCGKHRDVRKSLIKKYREARKAKKLKAAA